MKSMARVYFGDCDLRGFSCGLLYGGFQESSKVCALAFYEIFIFSMKNKH